MDIREQAIKAIKGTDKENPGSTLLQKVKLFAWESGLGPVINALPGSFGQQAVLYFPGRSGKFSFPCFEQNGKILLALTNTESERIISYMLQNPVVEIWLKNGWFAGAARLLTDEEKNSVIETVSDERFFGNMSSGFGKKTLKDHQLLEVTRSAPCTGEKGPGSKAWVWPAAAVFLLFSRRKK